MTTDAKEFLRRAFESGALDVTVDFETVRDFVAVFARESVAFRAIDMCRFLTPKQETVLGNLARGERTAGAQDNDVRGTIKTLVRQWPSG